MVIVFTQHITPRLTYVLDFMFKSKDLIYKVTTSTDEFKKSELIKINYSTQNIDAHLQIQPQGILFSEEVTNDYQLIFNKNEWLINDKRDDFSVIFYFLSRYEEYVILNRDEHDRFSAKDSFITKNNRLEKPNVDLIIKAIWKRLGLDYSSVQKQFNTLLTFDIDSAWAVKNKGFLRSFLSDVKDLSKGKCIRDKYKVRLNKKKDPFDTFSVIKQTAKVNNVICFFLMADWAKYDKNIHWKNNAFQLLINDIKESCEIGIHPSYQSYLKPDIISKEIERLHKISGNSIVKSRQHYLKLKLPQTYQQLIKLGVSEDYTMGFADAYGFRAGTSFAFPFYDLSLNKTTSLMLYPITYMDGTLNQYLKLSIETSINVIHQLKQEVKEVGGVFVPLWHNETLGDKGEWKGWLKVFESNFD